jgi:signal transduction histidine kinase
VATDPITLSTPAAAPAEAKRKPFRFQQQPFFEDKNRAFWILQSAGWAGYFLLRTLSGIANNMGWSFLLHTSLLTGTGYSITLLMAAAYRRLIRAKPIVTWASSIGIVLVAAASFSAIETWSYATFLRPGSRPEGVQFLSAILLTFSLLIAWSALYYAINYYLLLEERHGRMSGWKARQARPPARDAALSAQPALPVQHPQFDLDLVLLKQTEQANAMLSRLSSFLRYTAGQRADGASDGGAGSRDAEALPRDREDALRGTAAAEIPHRSRGCRCAPPLLLLQPLVENAIKYAVTPQEEGADISVDARKLGDRVLITVQDTGPGADAAYTVRAEQSTGVGLANIRDRLAQAYGADHRFETQTNIQGGFSVTVEIPYSADAPEESK